MSKARRLCTKCPPSRHALLLKAYVMPILTYGCEVLKYNVKHIDSMNKLIIKYARWATGLPPHACTNGVLRETVRVRVQYEIERDLTGANELLFVTSIKRGASCLKACSCTL